MGPEVILYAQQLLYRMRCARLPWIARAIGEVLDLIFRRHSTASTSILNRK
jgi:hypothetical protein